MNKINSLVFTVLFLMFTSTSIAQSGSFSNEKILNVNNRGFEYLSSTTQNQFSSQFMGNTTLTNIGSPSVFEFPGAMFRHPSGIYVVSQASPYSLYKIDTLTANRTFIFNITGLTKPLLTGMTFDGTQIWGVQTDYYYSQIGTVDFSTGIFTPRGTPTPTVMVASMLNAAPNGTLFSVNIYNPPPLSTLYKWNKVTGVATLVGSIGIDLPTIVQDGDFDMSDGKYYWAANTNIPNCQLRIIDTTTGSSTLVGYYPSQVSSMVVIPPRITLAHDYTVTNFLSLPSEWVKDVAYIVKGKVSNIGSSQENNVPVKFFVNGILTGAPVNLSLDSNRIDSVSFPWTPTTAGSYKLQIASVLTTDLNKYNDTATINITVFPTPVETIFYDPFTNASNWTLTSSGIVPWSIQTTIYPGVTLPPTAVIPVLSCNTDEVPNSNSNATATLTTGINCTGKSNIYLSFDSDWNTSTASDVATVDASYDGGTTWVVLANWAGQIDRRNATEILQMPGAENKPNVKVRFKCVQPGWDWWWVIDNVRINGHAIVTGTENHITNIPDKYSLSQNYPNPFNPSTKIDFALPFDSKMSVALYDITGRKVMTLIHNELRTAGYYTVDFNGSSLSSGMYFYRFIAETSDKQTIITKKMMLIK